MHSRPAISPDDPRAAPTDSTSGRAAARHQHGLTLVELIFVFVILGILLVIAIPQYQNYQYKIQVQQATTDVRALSAKVDLYYTDAHQFPPDLTAVGCTAITCIDPWGFPYEYINHASLNGNGHVRRDRSLNPLNADYDLYSVGRDGQTKFPITQSVSLDDVIRAGTGTYFGLASAF